jgi:polyribonucleotide nucleotidyltransferase
VTRLAEFGAFVEIIPGTDGLLHISEVAEHRIKDIKDELKEGDQVLVKVLSVEGNRIKLSRKAILKEQRAKMEGQGAPASAVAAAPEETSVAAAAAPERSLEGSAATFEGGFDDDAVDEDDENFNREGTPNEAPSHARAGAGAGTGAAAGSGDPRRRRRRGPRGPRPPRT